MNCCTWSTFLIQYAWFLKKILKLPNSKLILHKRTFISGKISHLFWKWKVKAEPEHIYCKGQQQFQGKKELKVQRMKYLTWAQEQIFKLHGKSLHWINNIWSISYCNWRVILQVRQYIKELRLLKLYCSQTEVIKSNKSTRRKKKELVNIHLTERCHI